MVTVYSGYAVCAYGLYKDKTANPKPFVQSSTLLSMSFLILFYLFDHITNSIIDVTSQNYASHN